MFRSSGKRSALDLHRIARLQPGQLLAARHIDLIHPLVDLIDQMLLDGAWLTAKSNQPMRPRQPMQTGKPGLSQVHVYK